MSVSICIPVYNSSTTIGQLVQKLVRDLDGRKLEIVLVNDGSSDNSHDVCLELISKYPDIVKYVHLARNFGEHNAVMAGLNYAEGDYVVIMDDDFQNPPDEVMALVNAAEKGNYDAVYTYYEDKKHNWFRNMGSRLHNWMAAYLLSKPKDLYLSSFKCINRFTVSEVTKYTGPYPYIDGLILRCTLNVGKVKVTHSERQDGKSGYTLKKLFRLWLNMFLNFSILPLRFSSILGLVISLMGILNGVFVVIEKLTHPEVPVGWPSIIVIITIFAGVQLFMLGLIGEYLGTMLGW
jgi:undecaprenyl-phosphate 4-deoxy-4-formamido-L-arabinose transferase